MIINQGPLMSLELPSDWQREDSYARGTRIKFHSSKSAQTSFVVLYENRSMSTSSLWSFKEILGKRSTQHIKNLSPAEIRNLREVLGSTTVGDNQYSNLHTFPDPRTPAFNISSAHVLEIGGRPVLEVKGFFMDDAGNASNYTRALFTEGDDGKILKLFLQTPSQDDFLLSNRVFAQISSSIQWK